ncbi:MAG TPA: tetratricopeptide repeat protein [Candidatus Binatia bacterium]|jgi:tetratricopeptide (TPR) repeat protein
MRRCTGAALALVALAAFGGCAALGQMRGNPASTSHGDDAKAEPVGAAGVEMVRSALGAGNLDSAEELLKKALAPPPGTKPPDDPSRNVIHQTPQTPELLLLRAELRIRQQRYPEAESDALGTMALVPATSSAADVVQQSSKTKNEAAPRQLTQRMIHVHMAELYENAGRDDSARQHLEEARRLCLEDPDLAAHGDCEIERQGLVRILVARGQYGKAEPLVLAEIADIQSRFGSFDIRLSVAFCDAARFYARQGKYDLAGPLYARGLDVWKNSRDQAFTDYTNALVSGQPSPFDPEFLRPRAGHLVFAAPCGLEDQPELLFKLGKPESAADAAAYEQQLWAGDTEAGASAQSALDALEARGGDALDIAAARHAVAFVALKKRESDAAERELRGVVDAYTAAWPTLPLSERRYRCQDYLAALESLVELLRSSKRFPEAVTLGHTATEVASATLDAYDSLRLDTLLSLAKTYREMNDVDNAEAAAGNYLDAIIAARGDTSPDYAWALRTISFAYLLKDEIDASERMEMQAKAIWAKQSTVAPAF